MSSLVRKAEDIARMAHAEQVDKAGQPYIGHIERVAARVTSDEAKCVAWLHDVLEDSDVLPEAEMRRAFGDVITDGVLAAPAAVEIAAKLQVTTEQLGMKAGMLCGMLFPLVAIFVYRHIWKGQKNK